MDSVYTFIMIVTVCIVKQRDIVVESYKDGFWAFDYLITLLYVFVVASYICLYVYFYLPQRAV